MQHAFAAFRALLVATVVTGLAYPLVTLGIAQLIASDAANGTLWRDGSRVRGSWLIGQAFVDERHFQGRPSAAGGGYDPSASGATNLAPSSSGWVKSVEERARSWQRRTGRTSPVPIELVTASGSGLDPHLSVAAARYQIPSIARARGIAPAQLEELIERYTERTFLGADESRVNALRLNAALDAGDP